MNIQGEFAPRMQDGSPSGPRTVRATTEGHICQLHQDAVLLTQQLLEVLQEQHTVSTTHYPTTYQEHEKCDTVVHHFDTHLDDAYMPRFEAFAAVRERLLEFIHELLAHRRQQIRERVQRNLATMATDHHA